MIYKHYITGLSESMNRLSYKMLKINLILLINLILNSIGKDKKDFH
jgi:hypothetical protein